MRKLNSISLIHLLLAVAQDSLFNLHPITQLSQPPSSLFFFLRHGLTTAPSADNMRLSVPCFPLVCPF